MKTLIAYATNHGTTEHVAKLIEEKSTQEVTLVNLKKEKNVDLHPYDQIIIGGSIHAGTIQKPIRQLLEGNMPLLLQKRIGLFLSCMYEQKAEEQFEMAFPEILRSHAISKQLTGGEFRFEKMNFIERIIVKKIVGVKENVNNIKQNSIDEIIKEMNLLP